MTKNKEESTGWDCLKQWAIQQHGEMRREIKRREFKGEPPLLIMYYLGREQELLLLLDRIEELERPSDEPNEPEYTFGDG